MDELELLELLLETGACSEETELLLSEEVLELVVPEAFVPLHEPNVSKDSNAKKETNFDLMIV